MLIRLLFFQLLLLAAKSQEVPEFLKLIPNPKYVTSGCRDTIIRVIGEELLDMICNHILISHR